MLPKAAYRQSSRREAKLLEQLKGLFLGSAGAPDEKPRPVAVHVATASLSLEEERPQEELSSPRAKMKHSGSGWRKASLSLDTSSRRGAGTPQPARGTPPPREALDLVKRRAPSDADGDWTEASPRRPYVLYCT